MARAAAPSGAPPPAAASVSGSQVPGGADAAAVVPRGAGEGSDGRRRVDRGRPVPARDGALLHRPLLSRNHR